MRRAAGRVEGVVGPNGFVQEKVSDDGHVPTHDGWDTGHTAPSSTITYLSLDHGAIDGSRADIKRSWLARSSSHVERERGGDRGASDHTDRDFVFLGGEVRLRVAEYILQGVHRNQFFLHLSKRGRGLI